MHDGDALTAAGIAAFHDAVLADWDAGRGPPPARHAFGVWHAIERNHVCNNLACQAEAHARRTGLADAEIVACRRAVDRHHAGRLAALELVDVALLAVFDEHRAGPRARLSSETPGAMIDRLSLLAVHICRLKHAIAPERDARAVAPALRALAAQRRDLCDCLDRLLRELADGEARFRLYGPPALHPVHAHRPIA